MGQNNKPGQGQKDQDQQGGQSGQKPGQQSQQPGQGGQQQGGAHKPGTQPGKGSQR
ncbi:MAG: hypothetical protein JWL87_37 [Candidatus Adlerbacteria bacterium]|nr:hypothetical protein [Candidatus Adlerbacteria bacterium]